jgi:hypothetical protein
VGTVHGKVVGDVTVVEYSKAFCPEPTYTRVNPVPAPRAEPLHAVDKPAVASKNAPFVNVVDGVEGFPELPEEVAVARCPVVYPDIS